MAVARRAGWSIALWRRWPDALYDRRKDRPAWYWLTVFRIPKTRENCVRFARGICYMGNFFVSVGTIVVLAFGR